ncbi:MAG: ABC-2 transporter permease [Ruminococcaceae bacterium]|nr:ABC-2 transporter permease [Oscillospiraceae bacterium]
MKGLILKDLYGVKFQIIGAFLIMLLPIVIMIFGERNSLFGVGAGIALMPNGLLNYVVITTCSSFLLNTLDFDERSGWSKMQRGMPLSGGKIIGAKLCTMGLVLAALTLIFLAANVVGVFVHGLPIEPAVAMPICLCMVQTMALSPTFAFGYRFGSKATTAAYIGIEIVLAAAMICLLLMIFVGSIGAALRVIAYAGLPVLTAAVVAVSWITGKRAVMMIDI